MPKFLEDKLKKEYPGNDAAVYGTMNAIGAVHGNKETPKGQAMEAKHNAKFAKHASKKRKNQRKAAEDAVFDAAKG